MWSLRTDCSKELTLWEAIGGRDNGLSYRPSLLYSHMCHVAGAFEIQYNTIQLNKGAMESLCVVRKGARGEEGDLSCNYYNQSQVF